LHDLQCDRYPLEAEEVAALSPYLMQHINRFGRYDKAMLVDNVRPEQTVGASPGANQAPFALVIPIGTNEQSCIVNLTAVWIDETAVDAMIPQFVAWARQWFDTRPERGFRNIFMR
jgi:hypothetical protein